MHFKIYSKVSILEKKKMDFLNSFQTNGHNSKIKKIYIFCKTYVYFLIHSLIIKLEIFITFINYLLKPLKLWYSKFHTNSTPDLLTAETLSCIINNDAGKKRSASSEENISTQRINCLEGKKTTTMLLLFYDP